MKKKQTGKVAPKKAAKKKVAKKRVSKKTTPQKKKDDLIIVQSPVDPSIQIVTASEFADDDIIEQELQGNVLPYYIYEFVNTKDENKTVRGLSVKGVNEVVRQLNRNKKSGYNIRIKPEFLTIERNVIHDDKLGVEVAVFAENLLDGTSGWGVKFEAYKKPKKNGEGFYDDKFAPEKALSKAERNAKRKLIPEDLIALMIKKLIKKNDGGNVKQLDPFTTETTIIIPKKPMPSTRNEMERLFIATVDKVTDKKILGAIFGRIKDSDLYTDAFKAKMKKKIDKKLSELK